MYRDNPKLYHDQGKDNAAKLAKGEIKAWNKRKVQSVITQGILQGESIPQLTKRLERVTGGAHAAAIRNARTMMTGTQNAGRIDAMDRAKDMGIPVRKQWLATLDTRTRIWHRELDGKIEDIDKPFENSVGKIMFPGDPDADGANIYCCRCTLLSAIKGFEIDASDINLRHNKNLKGMTYEQWKNEKKSTSNPITLPEEKAEAIKGSYARQYREG
jgi:SPP1 gp7 family putative phage head morphogenesis protein